MNKSDSIIKLATALVKFNSEISKVAKDASNPFYKNKYASLDSIIDEARPVLTKNGLSILQLPSGDGEHAIMKTLLLHESGEWIESEALIIKPVKSDPQAYGSCISYMRRYSLTSFLSLNTGEDDDANNSSGKGTYTDKPKDNNDADAITTQMLLDMAESKGFNEEKVCKKYKVSEAKFIKKEDKKAAYENFKKLPNK